MELTEKNFIARTLHHRLLTSLRFLGVPERSWLAAIEVTTEKLFHPDQNSDLNAEQYLSRYETQWRTELEPRLGLGSLPLDVIQHARTTHC